MTAVIQIIAINEVITVRPPSRRVYLSYVSPLPIRHGFDPDAGRCSPCSSVAVQLIQGFLNACPDLILFKFRYVIVYIRKGKSLPLSCFSQQIGMDLSVIQPRYEPRLICAEAQKDQYQDYY